jgi:ABC-type Na+ transport system ATPase subunit NatA
MLTLPREILLLLSPSQPENIAYILGLAGLCPTNAPLPRSVSLTLCTHQTLFPGHLTARESLTWMAALWGLSDAHRVAELLRLLDLPAEMQKTPVAHLPPSTLRTLHWLAALLPDPDVVLVDDLAADLSPSAKRHLWQFLRTAQERRPRTIFYTTPDHDARTFADQIWLLEGGEITARYHPATLPDMLRATTGYAFTLKTARAAEQFYTEVSDLPFVQKANPPTPRIVEVWVPAPARLVDLTWLAGFALESFQTLPIASPSLSPSEFARSNRSFSLRKVSFSSVSRLSLFTPLLPLALNEWRGHFRSFWKYGNLIFTSLYLLMALLLSGEQTFASPADFWQRAPLFLLFSATLSFGLGLESFNRLGSMGEETTLFQSAQPVSATRPLSRLSLCDLTPTGRGTLLLGMSLGQFALLLIHNWSLLFFVWSLCLAFSHPLPFLAASGVFWSLSVFATLSAVVWLGSWMTRPGWGTLLGWGSWFVAILSGYGLASWGQPFTWLWPLAGYTAAFQRLAHPAEALWPFLLALTGTVAMGWAAWRAFVTRPSHFWG